MDGTERRTPGQAMMERMEARTRRRPRLGMTPAFYTRLGLEDPWAVEGFSFEPEARADGMVFLSAAPYYAMLRKLAAARKRRERRQSRFFERRAGTTLRAAARSWPGEKGISMSRVARLAVADMLLPEPAPVAVAPVQTVEGAPVEVRRRNEPTPSVANPWLDTPFTPARVVRADRSAARPMDRAGARAVHSQREAADEKALGTLRHIERARVVRVRDQIELVEAAPVEVVRVVRRANVARTTVREVEEVALSTENARPTSVARARMQGAASRGLRPVVLSSPAMAMATADYLHAADVDRATAGALAAPPRGEAMRAAAARRIPATQRASARATSGSSMRPETLSASPVSSSRTASARPVAASPVARSSARDGGAGGRTTNDSPSLSPARARPSAVATARLRHAEIATVGEAAAAPISVVSPVSRRVSVVRDGGGVLRRPARSEAGFAASQEAQVVGAVRRVRTAPGGVLPPPVDRSVGETSVLSAAPSVRASMRAEAPVVAASSVPRPVSSFSRVPREAVGGAAPETPSPIARSTSVVRTANARFVPARVARLAAASSPEMAPIAFPASVATPVISQVRRAEVVGGDASSQPAATAKVAAARVPVAAPLSPRREAVLAAPSVKWAAERAVWPAPSRSVVPRPVPMLDESVEAPPEARRVTPALSRLAAVESPLAVSEVAAPVARATRAAAPSVVRSLARSAPESVVILPVPAESAESSPGAPARIAAATLAPATAFVPASPSAAATPPASRPTPAPVKRSAVVAAAARDRSVQARKVSAASPAHPLPRAATRAGAVRRTGPLSWARSESQPGLMASFVPALSVRRGAAGPAPARPSRLSGAPVLALATHETRSALQELAAAGLVSNEYSPSTPVRTPDGRFVSARVAAAIPGLAVLPAAQGPVAVAAQAPAGRTAGFRTPEVRFIGAETAVTPDGVFTGARIGRTPQTEWVSARSAVTESTAYRGAISARTPDLDFFGAPTVTTPDGEFVGARVAGAARRPRRTAAVAPEMMFGEPVVSAGPAPEAAVAGAPIARRRRGLDSTLIDTATGVPMGAEAPVWAARSEGAPLVRSAQGLFDSLARATTAEQVVQVIAARAGGFEGAVPLTEPMRDVVQAIRNELASSPGIAEPITLATRAPDIARPPATVLRGTRVNPVASSAISRRGAVRPVRSSAVTRGPGGADDRVSKLVKRLTDLIHLAEIERRLSDAQGQVRMAEDTAAARGEASAPVGQSAGGGPKLDVETFTREVLEVVNRELELRRERRTEDGDESNWW